MTSDNCPRCGSPIAAHHNLANRNGKPHQLDRLHSCELTRTQARAIATTIENDTSQAHTRLLDLPSNPFTHATAL